MYCDLKFENFVLKNKDKNFLVCVIDFGLFMFFREN